MDCINVLCFIFWIWVIPCPDWRPTVDAKAETRYRATCKLLLTKLDKFQCLGCSSLTQNVMKIRWAHVWCYIMTEKQTDIGKKFRSLLQVRCKTSRTNTDEKEYWFLSSQARLMATTPKEQSTVRFSFKLQ